MTALMFDTCCGCIELKSGILIVGYLNAVVYSIYVIVFLFLEIKFAAASHQALKEHKNNPNLTAGVATFNFIAILLIVIFLLYLIINIVLLVGVHKNKRGHVKAFLIGSLLVLILSAICFIYGLSHPPLSWSKIWQPLIELLLHTYFLLVVRSYYYKMNDARLQPAIYNTA